MKDALREMSPGELVAHLDRIAKVADAGSPAARVWAGAQPFLELRAAAVALVALHGFEGEDEIGARVHRLADAMEQLPPMPDVLVAALGDRPAAA